MASDKHDDVLPGEDLEDSSSTSDEEDVDEDDDEEEEENDDVLASASPSTSSAGNDAVSAAAAAAAAAKTVTIALPAIPNGDPSPATTSAIHGATAIIAAAAPAGERKPLPAPMDDSRKLFQRLWTDEDEIELLQGFLDYSSHRGNRTTHHGQNDTALFYDQIKSKLQLEFNKNQLVEKLRRLKKKYRNVVGKISSGKDFSFKSPHDQATFEISRKIWANLGVGGVDIAADDDDPIPGAPVGYAVEVKGEDSAGGFLFERRSAPAIMASATARSRKRSRPKPDLRTEDRRGGFAVETSTPIAHHAANSHGPIGHNSSSSNGDVRGLIEESVRNYVSPMIKELLHGGSRGFGGLAASPIPMSFGAGVPSMNLGMFGDFAAVVAGDERWRKQQILELEVYSKRLELVQDQIRAALDDLRSRGGS